MSNSERLIHKPERAGTGWFRDRDGIFTSVQDNDETNTYQFDYAAHLNSGETISASAWADEGVTTSSPSLATPVATVKVTGTDGGIKNTLTTSAGRTLIYRYRFVSPLNAQPWPRYVR